MSASNGLLLAHEKSAPLSPGDGAGDRRRVLPIVQERSEHPPDPHGGIPCPLSADSAASFVQVSKYSHTSAGIYINAYLAHG